MTELTFMQLKKNARKGLEGVKETKLAVLGNCATQHLAQAIKGFGVSENINFEVFDADYDQIDAQLMDEGSEYFAFSPAYTVLYMCTEKLYPDFVQASDKLHFAENTFAKIRGYWDMINSRTDTRIIQFMFVEADDRAFGNFGSRTPVSFIYQLRKLNYLIQEGCQEVKNVFPMDMNYIQDEVGRDKLFDDKFYYLAKMPVSTALLPEVACQVTDIVKSCMGRIKKCVICDLDNTLWGGVIGDDGLEGIEIGELGQGHAFEDLQRWLKQLKERGIILGVCSKNEEAAAKLPFEQHPDMILHLDDFSIFVANWEDKASNIRHIQETLNIGMDSIVFLDDNPFERRQVQSMIPDITIPELPEDPARYLSYLKSLNLFETASWSAADKDRTAQYQAEVKRTESVSAFANYDEYLQSLDMEAEAKAFDKFQFPRIAQLTQRSNQFNLRTVRLSEAEVEEMAKDDRFITLYFTLKDKFGDHGLISVAVMEKTDSDTLFMYNWLMSCRVLKRGMEEFIINKILQTAADYGFKKVIGEYIQTPKNAMVKDIYGRLGFKALGDGRFEADVDTFIKNKTFIEEETGETK